MIFNYIIFYKIAAIPSIILQLFYKLIELPYILTAFSYELTAGNIGQKTGNSLDIYEKIDYNQDNNYSLNVYLGNSC